MRHRERHLGPTIEPLVMYNWGSVAWTKYVTTYLDNGTIDDIVDPYYRGKVRAGQIVNNPCTMVFETFRREGMGFYSAYYTPAKAVQLEASGPVTGGLAQIAACQNYQQLNLTVPDTSDMIHRAKFKAVKNMDTTPYAFGEDALEIRETIKFLRNPLAQLSVISKAFKKKRKRLQQHGLTRAQALSGAYLQYRFAITPLVSSLNDGIAAIYDKQKLPKRRSGRGFEEFEYSEDYVWLDTFNWQSSALAHAKVSAVVLYQVSNPVDTARERLGFRFKDIPTTLWAVAPYSFMVDRLIDVSGGITNLMNLADPTLEVLAGSYTVRTTQERKDRVTGQNAANYVVTINADTMIRKRFTYTRIPWTPTWHDAVPPIDLGGLTRDLTSTADLLTLILQRFR
jgi:hypothetical protein